MTFELFVAKRYLFSRRKQAFIYVISLMAILGVALGVGALVVVLGVYNGMTTDMRDKILGANAHGVILSYYQGSFQDEAEIRASLKEVKGVTGSTPFIYSEGMLSSPGNSAKGIVLRGIDPDSAKDVISMLRNLQAGKVEDLNSEGPAGIIIGAELAKRLSLGVGSRVNLLSPSGSKSAAGYQPKVQGFEVVGIFKTGMFEYDTSLAFISLAQARKVLGLEPHFLTGLEFTVKDVFEVDEIAKDITKVIEAPYYVRTWTEMNANLFAALKLEKIGMFILLAMVVLIGSFSIVATLVMLVMEKTRDIAVMMSMGATPQMIRKIFMLQGTIIGFIGTILGYILGFGVGYLLKRYQFIKLPENVYTLDHLPIIITVPDVLIIGASAMLLCFLATIYPSRQASRLKPTEALRYE
ncbi:MAG: ABC transporter permease [Desulfovibrionaceae bacterium]|nr:ABC transporter permease [Desulfovibrionaceae bacterium]